MTKDLGGWLFGYGLFLFACGAATYVSNPVQAPTPVVAGAIAGGLSAFFGVLVWKDTKWVPKPAMMMTVIFLMLGIALSMQHWILVINGKPEMVGAAISSAIVVASGAMIWALKTKA